MMELVSFVGSLCTLSSFTFQLVGMHVCYGIIKKGSLGDMSSFTFISYFVACAVWLKYGLIVNNWVLIAVNAYGAFLNFIYTMIFYRYSVKKTQIHRFFLLGVAMTISPLTYVKYYQTDSSMALNHLGSYCVCLTVIGYGAPLISLVDVVKSKSTESLSFVLILANLGVGILWTIYGGLVGDKYVQGPNGLGAVLALLQLSLFAIYPTKHKRA
ncbi:sugar transporter SWEET1-like isoform X2 [Mya arenaria]|uniref:sugar transporter SWEET1-like isoform X2 n=1 Tax=Mya arenaria TaxID=6604 RepID=UPI0022E6A95C|nr:sugar transporter SWEET1-like isoform X2 [Mya arenaria]